MGIVVADDAALVEQPFVPYLFQKNVNGGMVEMLPSSFTMR